MAITHPKLATYTPSQADPFDATKAAHLMNRAGFGGTAAELERVLQLGPQNAVDWLLDFPDAPAEELSQDDMPDLTSVEGYPRNFREYRKLLDMKSREERMELQQQFQAANREAVRETMAWWVRRMAYGPFPLQEKLTFFWHGHFTTSARDERSAMLIWEQNECLRRHAGGNFRAFVHNISRDPAMLDYLNNTQNKKQRPNENYARELMELFTLGIGNYSEQDIKEAARAFTGWAHEGESFVFRKYDHDFDDKVFFGRKGKWDGSDVIEIILSRKRCANYIAAKVWAYFVAEPVDDQLAAALGDVLYDARYDVRPLLRTIFTSKGFYDPKVIGSQIKSPVQLVVGTIRQLGLEMPSVGQLRGALEQMGQVPLMPPNVKGWPGGRLWVNTSTLFVRYNTAVWLAGGEIPVAPGRRLMDRAMRRRGQSNFKPDGGRDADAVVDAWVTTLIGRPIGDSQRKLLREALGDRPDREENVRRMVQLIVSMPEYQLC
ncbi:MAG TPA: DUF1800 domain-containing protein [Tepidisphaeraceae bacterium]|jgi:hypothetical protein|nr:DUF1800 domain-containing protein [Tepidisphaeraceae bacterium]